MFLLQFECVNPFRRRKVRFILCLSSVIGCQTTHTFGKVIPSVPCKQRVAWLYALQFFSPPPRSATANFRIVSKKLVFFFFPSLRTVHRYRTKRKVPEKRTSSLLQQMKKEKTTQPEIQGKEILASHCLSARFFSPSALLRRKSINFKFQVKHPHQLS